MPSAFRIVCCLLSLLAFSVPAAAQADATLLGQWIGTGGESEGVELLFEAEFVTVDGNRMPMEVVAPGVLLIGGSRYGERVGYEVKGDHLALRLRGGETRYRRVAKTPEPVPVPIADPFARTFAGEHVVLALKGSMAEGYQGQLTIEGKSHAVTARGESVELDGVLEGPEGKREFRATLKGDELTLELDGKRHLLEGEQLLPPELEGVYDGPCGRYEHERGWLGFDMPRGWSVGGIGNEGMTLNLGLDPNVMPEGIVGLMWGRVPVEDQNRPVAEVIAKYVPQYREALKQEGLLVGQPEGPIRTYRGKDVPGAVVSFQARAITGQTGRVWLGGIIKRDSWVMVGGTFVTGKDEVYLPKLKRIFVTLEPRPPERNPKLEALMVGKTFSSSSYGRVVKSSFHASYTFHANGLVTRRLMSNVTSTPGLPGTATDSERTGNYEVCGADVIFLFFESGQSAGQLLMEGDQVVGFQVGSAQFR